MIGGPEKDHLTVFSRINFKSWPISLINDDTDYRAWRCLTLPVAGLADATIHIVHDGHFSLPVPENPNSFFSSGGPMSSPLWSILEHRNALVKSWHNNDTGHRVLLSIFAWCERMPTRRNSVADWSTVGHVRLFITSLFHRLAVAKNGIPWCNPWWESSLVWVKLLWKW